MNTNNVINNILGGKPKCDRRSKNKEVSRNDRNIECPSCGADITTLSKRMDHPVCVKCGFESTWFEIEDSGKDFSDKKNYGVF